MSQANPVRLFVTHAWETSEDYLRVFEYLESARNFFYRNYSTPDKPPAGADKEAQREDLRRQIAPVEVVIALRADTPAELLTFQMLFAQASHKPVILMKPFGQRRDVPKEILRARRRDRRVGRARAGRCHPPPGAPRRDDALGHDRVQARLINSAKRRDFWPRTTCRLQWGAAVRLPRRTAQSPAAWTSVS